MNTPRSSPAQARRPAPARFGIFRAGQFTPLPALPVSAPLPAGVLAGTVAW